MSDSSQTTDRRLLIQNALQAIEDLQGKLDAVERAKTEPIAIIGLSCRFPGGANNPEAYWQLLQEGRDAIREVPADRFDVSHVKTSQPIYGGFLDSIDQFEPVFFGISPREANTMDPQQRLVLEVSWEALERAGIRPEELFDTQAGVFIGITTNDYSRLAMRVSTDELDVYTATGSALNVTAGRVAYTLGLHGPTLAVDSACSSSSVAIHLACQSLRNRESNLMLAGGVNVLLNPEPFIMFSRWGMMAPDGRCKTFDTAADGFVRAEGCGMLVLKRLSDAQAAGDPILAIIRGSAVNEDGKSSGLTVPNGIAQQAVIRSALAAAGLKPGQISYVEAHGTGTSLGDPIEVEAVGVVLGEGRTTPLIMGSVKTNIGHCESASGVAGLIKTVLALQHNEIPPHLHFKERSPRIPWPNFPIQIPTERTPWLPDDEPRRAGISSFGFSGVNAHIILEEAPYTPTHLTEKEIDRPMELITLAARSERALKAYAHKLAEHFSAHPDLSLANTAHTLATSRTQYPYRLAIAAASTAEAAEKLKTIAPTHLPKGEGKRKIAFLFTGQGAQYVEMGHQLYETQPVFRAALNGCDEILQGLMGESILGVLYPIKNQPSTIDHTTYTQPVLFALEYALAELWKSWGIKPDAVMGHSVGEYAAACVAGVFSLEDGLKLIAGRGRMMGSLPPGGEMAAVFAPLERVQSVIENQKSKISIAAINGPENIVISGDGAAIQEILAKLADENVKARALTVSHAFHSPQMEPILADFERLAASIRMTPPQINLVANVTARVAGQEVTRPGYWRQHIRQPVRFSESIAVLRELGCNTFIEIGPNPTLLSMAQRCLPGDDGLSWLPSLRKGKTNWDTMLSSLGELYSQGVEVDWQGYEAPYSPVWRIALPTYPFQRQRYWIETASQAPDSPIGKSSAYELAGPVRIPRSNDITFSLLVGTETPAFVTDHRIYGTVIFPGAGYLGLVADAAQALGISAPQVTNFEISEALVIPEEKTFTLTLLLQPQADGQISFEMTSLEYDHTSPLTIPAEWKKHASGVLQAGDLNLHGTLQLAELQSLCNVPLDVDDYYQQLASVGLDYGPLFRGLQALWRTSEGGQALGRISLPETVGDTYQIHPGLLDACFQIIGAALPESSGTDDIYMPVGAGEFTLYRPVGRLADCYIRLHPVVAANPDVLTADLLLFTPEGEICARLNGLRIQRARRQVLQRLIRPQIDQWLYEVTWRPYAYTPPVGEQVVSSEWLILADKGGFSEQLAAELRQRGVTCTLKTMQPDFDESAAEQILAGFSTLNGIISLWALGADEKHPLDAQRQVCGHILALAKGLEKSHLAPNLWLVTRHAQPVGDGHRVLSLAQSPLWGMGRTLALEFPQWWGGLVDLDRTDDPQTAASLAQQLLWPDGEDQIAYRHETNTPTQRFVARLKRLTIPVAQIPTQAVEQAHVESSTSTTHPSYELVISQQGLLDGLTLRSSERLPPAAGEVEIQVFASGLNFRDVLNVLGMYPGEIPLGNECTGVVTAVGEGVSRINIGDCVIALGAGAFRSHFKTTADLVFPKPKSLSFAEAATVPTAFLTAWYGLHYLANLQAGQRVLIHAATGGVGLAAVRLAQRMGAEIFATAGNESKWRYLRAIGIQHIYNSRNADFADDLLRQTSGHGVDVVLNSLSDNFIPMSLSVLAEGGYFLEIGKRGIWTPEQVAEKYPHVRYHVYDLAVEMEQSPSTLQTALHDILGALDAGHLMSLPATTFPAYASTEAFRYMAQARHIGKIAVTHEPSKVIRPDSTYLITGGTGGLGLVVAQSFVQDGAGAVVLVSRSAPGKAVAERIQQLAASGTQVVALQADVSKEMDLALLLQQIREDFPPLRGIVHAAGVIDDVLLTQQDWPRFERVLAPKVAGAWNLHNLTQDIVLDFFVLFSAGAGIFGSVGQSSYATANAFLDLLAFHRKGMGLTALSIDWGAWADVGMAARLGDEHLNRWQAMGIQAISPEQGSEGFNQLVCMPVTQAAVLPIQWGVLLRSLGGAIPPILSELVGTGHISIREPGTSDKSSWKDTLHTAEPATRRSMLEELVRVQVAGVLGLQASQLTDLHQPLTELGLDSLMSVELSNRLRVKLGYPVPSTIAFEYRTIDALVEYLNREILPQLLGQPTAIPEALTSADQNTTAETLDPSQLLQNLDQLSDDEVDRLLRSL